MPACVLLVVLLALAACAPLPVSVAQTPVPLATCTPDEIAQANAALAPYRPSQAAGFVEGEGDHFRLSGERFTPRGVNYYPSRYPWRRFLTELSLGAVASELDLLQGAGLNTMRIFLWNEALFQCPGSDFGFSAVPNHDAFRRLDHVIRIAGNRGFRLIVTLNDLPDLTQYPLYSNPPHIQAQTEFIIRRYRDEAAIFAWDLRNEGDIDYGTHSAFPAKFARQTVLDWLNTTATQVRGLDPNHLLTAGWLNDSESTAPYVDFISFHHWTDAEALRQRILTLQIVTEKPILLEEFGYSTFTRSPDEQAQLVDDAIDTVESTGAAGWLVWTAFDFPLDATCIRPACPSADNAEHHFGLWNVDDTPKPTVNVLLQHHP